MFCKLRSILDTIVIFFPTMYFNSRSAISVMHAMRKEASVVSLIRFTLEFNKDWIYFDIRNTISIENFLRKTLPLKL